MAQSHIKHNDIKPGNCLIIGRGVVIADLGEANDLEGTGSGCHLMLASVVDCQHNRDTLFNR